MIRLRTILILVAVWLPSSASAYVEPVHEIMTKYAYERLRIDFAARFGRDAQTGPFGDPLKHWLRRGAHDEDVSIRPLSHFLDPIHGQPLTIGQIPKCIAAPTAIRADWWCGAAGSIGSTGMMQEFDLQDAQRHYYEAIVGTRSEYRQKSMADLFYTLGHVIHLVQDMAQPEHTRNDQHRFAFGATQASIYEHWGATYLLPSPEGEPVVSYEGYPTVSLPTFGSYFHTPPRDQSGWSLGVGMADFSNRSFVTQNTNYDAGELQCFKFDYPRLADTTERSRPAVGATLDDDGNCCTTVPYMEFVLSSSFPDYVQGSVEFDEAHSFYSSLNLQTLKYGKKVYSLGDESWHSRARILLPRAVGYSAGLLERFFRGSIAAEWKRLAADSSAYELKITNRSTERIGETATISSTFKASPEYFGGGADDAASIFDREPLRDLVPDFDGLPPGASLTISIPQVPGLKPSDSIAGFERRIAIEGPLGDEDAVISLVQPGGDVVRAEIRWDCVTGGNIAVESVPTSDEPIGYVGVHSFYPSGLTCGTRTGLPEACFSLYAGNEAQPLELKLAPATPGKTYLLKTYQHWPQFCRFKTDFYINDEVVKSEETTVTDGLFDYETFAQWP